MARFLGIAVVVIGTLGALTEIVSFTMDKGSFLVQSGRDLYAWLTPGDPRGPTEMTAEVCAQEKNLFVLKLCKDKENRKTRTTP